MAGPVPGAVVADRIGFAVDDVNRRLAGVPAPGIVRGAEEFVDVGDRFEFGTGAGGEDAVGGTQSEFHGAEGPSGIGIDDGAGAEIAAEVSGVGALEEIAFGGAGAEGEHAPIVDGEGDRGGGTSEGIADGFSGRFDECGECGRSVGEEAQFRNLWVYQCLEGEGKRSTTARHTSMELGTGR